jgi:hypothetical protein
MSYKECFIHADKDEDEAAECVHCLRKHGEWVYFDETLSRLALGRELYDRSDADHMERISRLLNIRDRKTYEEADEKFNLTMY